MSHLNIEIKARCNNLGLIRDILKKQNADFKGKDHQIDTYFKSKKGQLKLREGNIENALIFYDRESIAGPKSAHVNLYHPSDIPSLKNILVQSLETIVIVNKTREIYFIENVKFHIDQVESLGNFVEIEAIDLAGNIGQEKLQEQCEHYINIFKIKKEDLIDCSYSDLLLIEPGKKKDRETHARSNTN